MDLTQCGFSMLLCIINALRRAFINALENHTHTHKERRSTSSVKLVLIWTSAVWCLTYAASLCPGLAALGALCGAVPAPSSFPVAPQAPPEEECRFQVCRKLAS